MVRVVECCTASHGTMSQSGSGPVEVGQWTRNWEEVGQRKLLLGAGLLGSVPVSQYYSLLINNNYNNRKYKIMGPIRVKMKIYILYRGFWGVSGPTGHGAGR